MLSKFEETMVIIGAAVYFAVVIAVAIYYGIKGHKEHWLNYRAYRRRAAIIFLLVGIVVFGLVGIVAVLFG